MKRIYKDQQFKIRLTKQQLVAVRAAAKREGLSTTVWARSVLMAKCLALGPDEESRIRGITDDSPLSQQIYNDEAWRPKNRRGAARTADGRTSENPTGDVPAARKAGGT